MTQSPSPIVDEVAELTAEQIEAAARALCIAKGVNPDAAHYGTSDGDVFDGTTEKGQTFYWGWRNQVKYVVPTLAAYRALVSPPKAGAGEPVEWRYLQCGKGGWKHVYSQESVQKLHDDNLRLPKRRQHVIEPLYLEPPAAPNHEARGDGVRQLEWVEGEFQSNATAPFGAWYFVHQKGDEWFIHYGAREGYPSRDEAKAAAQLDYETRIRSALEAALPPLGDGRAEIVEEIARALEAANHYTHATSLRAIYWRYSSLPVAGAKE